MSEGGVVVPTGSAILGASYLWSYDAPRARMAITPPPERRRREGCKCVRGGEADPVCINEWLDTFRGRLERLAGREVDPAELATFDDLRRRFTSRREPDAPGLRLVAQYTIHVPAHPDRPASTAELRALWHSHWHDIEPHPHLPRWVRTWNDEIEPATRPAPIYLRGHDRARQVRADLLAAANAAILDPDDDAAIGNLHDAATRANALLGYQEPEPDDAQTVAAVERWADGKAKRGRGQVTQLAAEVSRVPLGTLQDATKRRR